MTTCRGANRVEQTLEPCLDPEKTVSIAIDISGIKVADPGDWITKRWRKLRDSLKVSIAVDFKSKQIGTMDVADERTRYVHENFIIIIGRYGIYEV